MSHVLRLARDAAGRVDSAKIIFLANMSHEIRTPLNGIMGLSDVLKSSALTVPQGDLLDDIGRSRTHLLSIVNDILHVAKVSSGKLTAFRPQAAGSRPCGAGDCACRGAPP